MVGWYHRLNGHEFEQAPGVGDGQGGLMYCSPWGREESDMTGWLNSNKNCPCIYGTLLEVRFKGIQERIEGKD